MISRPGHPFGIIHSTLTQKVMAWYYLLPDIQTDGVAVAVSVEAVSSLIDESYSVVTWSSKPWLLTKTSLPGLARPSIPSFPPRVTTYKVRRAVFLRVRGYFPGRWRFNQGYWRRQTFPQHMKSSCSMFLHSNLFHVPGSTNVPGDAHWRRREFLQFDGELLHGVEHLVGQLKLLISFVEVRRLHSSKVTKGTPS